jgi:hypothetical protein
MARTSPAISFIERASSFAVQQEKPWSRLTILFVVVTYDQIAGRTDGLEAIEERQRSVEIECGTHAGQFHAHFDERHRNGRPEATDDGFHAHQARHHREISEASRDVAVEDVDTRNVDHKTAGIAAFTCGRHILLQAIDDGIGKRRLD